MKEYLLNKKAFTRKKASQTENKHFNPSKYRSILTKPSFYAEGEGWVQKDLTMQYNSHTIFGISEGGERMCVAHMHLPSVQNSMSNLLLESRQEMHKM